jgi:methylglutamate dehydrogenase subunit B
MRITCPYCGPRDASEFGYGGDASRERPKLTDTDIDRWLAYVYERDNPRGALQEFWQHLHGCRQWLIAERDTSTHAISSVVSARDAMLGRGLSGPRAEET